jgi:hypothetical protein
VEYDVDLMYPLNHHQYQVKIPEVYVVMNNLIRMEIFVDEICIRKQVNKIFFGRFFCYFRVLRRIRFRAVDEYERICDEENKL